MIYSFINQIFTYYYCFHALDLRKTISLWLLASCSVHDRFCGPSLKWNNNRSHFMGDARNQLICCLQQMHFTTSPIHHGVTGSRGRYILAQVSLPLQIVLTPPHNQRRQGGLQTCSPVSLPNVPWKLYSINAIPFPIFVSVSDVTFKEYCLNKGGYAFFPYICWPLVSTAAEIDTKQPRQSWHILGCGKFILR